MTALSGAEVKNMLEGITWMYNDLASQSPEAQANGNWLKAEATNEIDKMPEAKPPGMDL